MGDEGFAAGTAARVAEASRKSVGPGFELAAGPLSPVAFLLSSVCREVFATFPPAHKEPSQA